jgi:hypothetical protein
MRCKKPWVFSRSKYNSDMGMARAPINKMKWLSIANISICIDWALHFYFSRLSELQQTVLL